MRIRLFVLANYDIDRYKMPYAVNKETKIYYEETGSGQPLLLHHGLTSSLEGWKHFNYIDTLREKYHLILMDARGHGKSSKPHDPKQYSMKHMTRDAVSVLDQLGISKVNFWGYSMGGRIGLAIGKYHPDRINSLIIGGNGLSEKDSKEQVEELKGYIQLLRHGNEGVVAAMEAEGRKMEPWMREAWLAADLEAYIAYCSNYENIGMAEYLPELDVPCLLYAGVNDTYPHSTAKACADIMKNAEFVSLPNLDHMGAFIGRDAVMPHILIFLEKVA